MKRLVFLAGLLLAIGCKGPTGETGAQGPAGVAGNNGSNGSTGPIGPQGPSGLTLLKTYTGTIPSDGNFILNVPEILNKRGITIVEAYFSFSGSPLIWTKMADGWLDNTINLGRIFAVSWDFGKVYFSFMSNGDNYLVQIYSASGVASAQQSHWPIGSRLLD